MRDSRESAQGVNARVSGASAALQPACGSPAHFREGNARASLRQQRLHEAVRARRRKVQRFETAQKFTRQIVVLTLRHPKPPPHMGEFVGNILF